jgi:FOG: Glucan-binding domain (YG repeat)
MKIKLSLIILLMSVLIPIRSEAATVIKNIGINITELKVEPGTVYPIEIKTNIANCEIIDITVSKAEEDWKAGNKVTYTMKLRAKEGCVFDRNNMRISISNGTIVSQTINSKNVTIKFNYLAKMTLPAPTEIYYEEDYLIKWERIPYVADYEIKINNGQRSVVERVNKLEFDLSNYITGSDDELTCAIRAIPRTDEQAKYMKASEWVDGDGVYIASDNTVYGSFEGNGNSIRFKTNDGYAVGWQFINGSWYYFDISSNRAFVSSWQKIDNKWYRFNNYGQMYTGWTRENGKWYRLGMDGAMHIGWMKEGRLWYYLGTDGAMHTGWLHNTDGKWYYLGADGSMYTNRPTPTGHFVDSNGVWIH